MPNKIEKVFSPTVLIPEISMQDVDTKEGRKKNGFSADDGFLSKRYGRLFPIIQINGRIFEPQEIVKMEIDAGGMIPTIYVMLRSYDGYFQLKKMPRDGGVVSIFISSRHDELNPIRNDFLITSIEFPSNSGDEGAGGVIRLQGVLDLPQWFGEKSKSVNGTSYEALQKIAKDLKVGFASNVSSTDDKMNWICPYDTYEKWIYDVYRSAYAGDNSFFDCFVDCYYHMNFIDLNEPFKETQELEDALMDQVYQNTGGPLDPGKVEKTFGKLMLTNLEYFSSSNIHISKYTVVNNTGNTSNSDGYRRVLQFFDRKEDEKFNIPVEPISGEGDFDTLKGRSEEEFNTKSKFIWMGVVDSDNVHENYTWAQVNNYQNCKQITKMGLNVRLSTFNFNIHRGMRVPVLITYQKDEIKVNSERDDKKEGKNLMTYDKTLSGYYVVTGIKYIFENMGGAFTMELSLSRREWPKLTLTEKSKTA